MAEHESCESVERFPDPRPMLQMVLDHNPFFLISGVLMLAGCFMINSAAHGDPDRVWPIVGLVAVFNVYEALVITLGLYLGRVRRLYRDAAFLLLLEVLLLCDVSLAYNELLLKSLPIGVTVGGLALLFAWIKLTLINRGLGLRITPAGVCMLSVLIAVLFVLPGLFRELTRMDLLREGHFYTAWWILGAAPLAAAVTQPWFALRPSDDPQLDKLRLWTARLLLVIPLGSLLLHLYSAHYVDDRPMRLYHLAPLVLGLATAWVYRRSRSVEVQQVVGVIFAAGGAAVAMSASFPRSMGMSIDPSGSVLFSPLRLVLVVTAVLFIYVWWWRGAWVCLPAAVGLLFTAGLGHTVSTITSRLQSAIRRAREMGGALMPDSITGWGVLAVLASFIFLGIGAGTSLMHRSSPVENKPR